MKTILVALLLLMGSVGYAQDLGPGLCLPLAAPASSPVFSPTGGSYGGTQTVTETCPIAGWTPFYTVDGSTPDYTSTLYSGPITVSSTQTLNGICGKIAHQYANEAASTAGWKQPDCQSPGVSGACVNDNPGGSGIPLSSGLSQPNLGNGSGSSGYTTSGCMTNSGAGPCMTFAMTPATTSQTNVLWPRTGGSSTPQGTWEVADSWVYYPASNGTKVSAYEHDQQIFDPTDTDPNYVNGLNYQWGMQCYKCDQAGLANWQIGGTTNTSWISTGITQVFAQGTWHHIVKEDKRILSELTTKPCYAAGAPGVGFPCEYYVRLILDGTSYDLQNSSKCTGKPAGSGPNGCTITTAELPTGFGANQTDQYQIDALSTTSPVQILVDNATHTVYYDPSSTTAATYTIAIYVGVTSASPGAGTYSSTQSVSLTNPTSAATICYTTDGSTPTAPTVGTCSGGTTQTYSSPISIASTTTLKALGSKVGFSNGAVTSATYTIP